MSWQRSRLLCCALLALCILCLTVQAQPPANVNAAVAKLTADVAAGKKISDKDAKAFAAKWDDLEDVMKAGFKPGGNAPFANVHRLMRQRMFTVADKALLTTFANRSRGMAIVTPHYDYKTKGNAAKKQDWDKYSKAMEEGAAALLQAIKAGGAPTISKELTNLVGSCTDCHGKFR
jgi:hypothetical protein